jgi:hypothetical protein
MQFFSKVILMQFLYSILSWFSSRIHLAAATLLVYLLLKNLLASWISVFLKITFPYQQKPLNSPAYPESNNSRTVERQSLQSAVDSRAPDSSLSCPIPPRPTTALELVIAIVHWWVTRGGSLHVVGIYIMGTP